LHRGVLRDKDVRSIWAGRLSKHFAHERKSWDGDEKATAFLRKRFIPYSAR